MAPSNGIVHNDSGLQHSAVLLRLGRASQQHRGSVLYFNQDILVFNILILIRFFQLLIIEILLLLGREALKEVLEVLII